MIPFLDLKRQFIELEAEVTAAATRVLSSGNYVLGLEVESFEKEWAKFCGVAGAAAVGSPCYSCLLYTSPSPRDS